MKTIPELLWGYILAYPPAKQPIVPWAEENFKIPATVGNVSKYESSLTPWTREPLESAASGLVRCMTVVLPVQSGKSTIGEILKCYWIQFEQGYIQENWEDDKKAWERYSKRIFPILKACPPVMERIGAARSEDRTNARVCLIVLPNIILQVQGQFESNNLDSDSVRLQINEEIHGWKPGHLAKAYNRTTRFWDHVIVNISNASEYGDQLHQAYEEGTQQKWEVKCPGCGQYHQMQIRWDDRHPELGGLRYESEDGQRGSVYDYQRLEKTIRYQMPCGYLVKDNPRERRALSLTGRYSSPQNEGAKLDNRSHSMEAVSVDYIPWLKLIQEKHSALKALRYGDIEPWKKYLTERECRFWNPDDRPTVGLLILSKQIKKSREGLKDRHGRYFAMDWQQGTARLGEFPHWWMVIRDVMPNGDSLLVWEGKCLNDDLAIEVLDDHGCLHRHGVADSGWDTTRIYQFCLKHGINAIKGEELPTFPHVEDTGDRDQFGEPIKVRISRVYEQERPLWKQANWPGPTQQNPIDEPVFFRYSKPGIRERLHFLRTSKHIKWEVPSDISDDYKKHMEAEQIEDKVSPSTGRREVIVKQLSKANHLLVCECYVALLMDFGGIIGDAASGI